MSKHLTLVNCTAETFTESHSGAIAVWIWEVGRRLLDLGFEVTVVSKSSPYPPRPWPDLHLLDYPAPRTRAGAHWQVLRRNVGGWMHVGEPVYNARLLRLLRSLGDLGVVLLQNNAELAAYLRPRLPEVPMIHHFQNHIPASPRFRRLYRRAAITSTAVSSFAAGMCAAEFDVRVDVLPSGVDSRRFQPDPRFGHGDRPPVINFLGLVDRHKGPDVLLDAAMHLRRRTAAPFSVRLVGGNRYGGVVIDDYQRDIDRRVAALAEVGVQVERTGPVGRDALPAILAQADINVVASRWHEAFGLVALEGMAAGLATIVSRDGGLPEVAGEAGWQFPVDDALALAGLLKLLIENVDVLDERRRRAREHAVKHDWDGTAAMVGALVERLSA